ncbi:MAG: DUF2752 domain-containing protein [Tannerellaceae bacterium]|nr:DUF2752 domain-containing protein [Tannerellaceae bacterium]
MGKSRLYTFVLLLSLAGSLWLYLNRMGYSWIPGGCLFHEITGLPCPACGSTRAVLACMNGHYQAAFFINPLGLLTVLLFSLFCIWILWDLLTYRDSFYRFYRRAEEKIRKREIACIFILTVVANWIWNITKHI